MFRQTRSHTNRELGARPGSPFRTPEGLLGDRGASEETPQIYLTKRLCNGGAGSLKQIR